MRNGLNGMGSGGMIRTLSACFALGRWEATRISGCHASPPMICPRLVPIAGRC